MNMQTQSNECVDILAQYVDHILPNGTNKLHGGPKKPDFLSKIRFIYISNKKHSISFKILSTEGNTVVQSFFPLCEASLEMPKHDAVECPSCEAVFNLLHVGKSLSFPFPFFTRG
jgi:hypothetical protein